MLGKEKSNEGPIHIYCRVNFNPFDYHGKVQQDFTID